MALYPDESDDKVYPSSDRFKKKRFKKKLAGKKLKAKGAKGLIAKLAG